MITLVQLVEGEEIPFGSSFAWFWMDGEQLG